MDSDDYRRYLERADAARTVRELRALSDEVQAAHPGDPSAELIDATCFTYATALIEVAPERRALERKRAAAPRSAPSDGAARVGGAGRTLGREVAFRPIATAADNGKRSRVD